MSMNSVDDLHYAEDLLGDLPGGLDGYCRPTCGHLDDPGSCTDDTCGCPCGHEPVELPPAEFEVTWSMPFDAEGPIDAAQQALGIHRDPASIATVFVVTDPHGQQFVVDLTADGQLIRLTAKDTREILAEGDAA